MSYHWKECCRLCLEVYLKFGKMLKQPAERELAEIMILHARRIKQSVLGAFAAASYAEALECLEQMQLAKNNCMEYHFQVQKRGLYRDFAEAYRIQKPIADMGYYQMALKSYFKEKFHPRQPRGHFHRRHALRRRVK
jgi:hypothetical protein